MEYFGPKWNAPITDPPAKQVPTPVDTDCLLCQEPIEEGESGVRHSVWGKSGGSSKAYIHKECSLRSILGSPSHIIDDDCTPEGHARDDKMTYREQALEVWRLVVTERASHGV